MLLSPRKNSLTSLFKEVGVFKEIGPAPSQNTSGRRWVTALRAAAEIGKQRPGTLEKLGFRELNKAASTTLPYFKKKCGMYWWEGKTGTIWQLNIRERPPGLIQHVLTVLVFWSWVLLRPWLPPSPRSFKLFPCPSILLHWPLDICLDLLPAAPRPPMQKRDAQHMLLQHRGARAEV